MDGQQVFDNLMATIKPAVIESYTGGLYYWDEKTFASLGGQNALADIVAHHEGNGFRIFTSKKVSDALIAAIDTGDLMSESQRLVVGRISEARERMDRLDSEFIDRRARVRTAAHAAWKQAKEQRDFDIFAPHLAETLVVVRELAARLGGDPSHVNSLYTALLGDYEPGMTSDRLLKILGQVRDWLVPKRREILERQHISGPDKLPGFFPIARQERLAKAALRTIGFDFKRGSLTTTEHPFMATVRPGDQRITTKFVPDHLEAGLFGSLHEGGHALFEQGVDPLVFWIGVPGFAYSLGLHESQSRLWENLVGRSRSFWLSFRPILVSHFDHLADLTVDDILRMVNRVKPGLIRIYSDEVSYNLHIILRVELELALLAGEVKVEDLPSAFADKLEQYIGVRPKHDAEGALQDIQWSTGSFGYFGTYCLGNLTAAQLYFGGYYQQSDPSRLAGGDFSTVLDWLRANVHPFGYVKTLDQALTDATGRALDPSYWFRYVSEKFPA